MCHFITMILPRVGLLLHCYGGPLNERIRARREAMPADDTLALSLLCMEEDVIYDIAEA